MNREYEFKRRSMGKKISTSLLVLFIILAAGAASLYAAYRYQLSPVDSGTSRSVSFEVPTGQSTPEIAARLRQAGLIRDKNIFVLYLNLHGLRGQLQAGSYDLAASKSTPQIADTLTKGKVTSDLLVIPEGSTLTQIKELAAKHGLKPTDFKTALADTYTSQYASQRPAGTDPEGYLFPDGYQISPATTAHQLIQTMLTTLDQKLSPDLVSALAAQGLSVHQGLTLASVIEREVANSTDRPMVAQVFLSRLAAGQALQSDVTVQYAATQAGLPFDLKLNSPYNTYANKGLPIGPICSPGLSALNAAAHPAKTNYLYFVAGKDGKTHFARTLAEHQANVAKYLK